MVRKEIVAVKYKNHIEQVSALQMQNAAFVMLNLSVHIITTVPWMFRCIEVGIIDSNFVFNLTD